MTHLAKSPFSALIHVPRTSLDAGLLGKDPAELQLDFALRIGCDRIVLLGDGGSGPADTLRRQAEKAGAKVVSVRGAHALAAVSREGGNILVLQDGLIPASRDVMDTLAHGKGVLVCPSRIGSEMGFERIDFERSWAGAMIISETLLPRLMDLPGEVDPASALLRIALQGRVAEHKIAESELSAQRWLLADDGADLAGLGEKWLAGIGKDPRATTSRRLAGRLARRLARGVSVKLKHVLGVFSGSLLFVGAAVAAAWFEYPEMSFLAVAVSVMLLEGAFALERVRQLPFGEAPQMAWARLPADMVLGACGYLAIWGAWYERAFPPLVLLAALHLPGAKAGIAGRLLGDRVLIALMLAGFTALNLAAPGIMLVALVALATNLRISGRDSG